MQFDCSNKTNSGKKVILSSSHQQIPVRIKIFEFYPCIIYIASEGRHVRIHFLQYLAPHPLPVSPWKYS
jgi:hypothetical protein